MSESLYNLTSLERVFLQQEKAIVNNHGTFLYKSDDGKDEVNLALLLLAYKEWLIENEFVGMHTSDLEDKKPTPMFPELIPEIANQEK